MRLLAMALACVFALAPTVAEVCEATCVDHVGHSESLNHAAHHHHGSSTTEQTGHHAAPQNTRSTDSALAPSVSHDCCYPVAVLTDSRDSKRGAAPSTVLTTPSTGAMTMRVSQSATDSHRHRPSVLIRPLSQLRV